ncbi:MAG: FHA domain-containing protein [Planctomycetota bacterium]|jgi:hypothetical protein
MARLILESGGKKKEYAVTGTVVLGRSKSNLITLDDRLLFESKNGTYVNGQLIRNPEVLNNGDRVRVGQYTFRFVLDPGEKVAVAPRPQKPPAEAPAPAASPPGRAARHAPPARPVPRPVPRPMARAKREHAPEAQPQGNPAITILLVFVFAVTVYVSKVFFVWFFQQRILE